MRKRKLLAAAVAAALIPVAAGCTRSALASIHREAPLISQDPVADNTDVYAFRDVADQTKVDLVANYIGLEDPAGGPNFAKFGDDVLYEIHIDNSGDVRDDITYQFRFRTIIGNGNTFLYNTNQINPTTYANQNVQQVYSVRRIKNGVASVLATNVPTPPVNVGVRSTPNYPAYVAKSIKTLPGGAKVFAGQRDDPFFVDLGSIFDLLGLRPLNPAHVLPLSAAPGRDDLSNKNVHSIVLQLPITSVSKKGNIPTVVNSKDSFIGVYASSSRQRVRVLSARGGAPRELGQNVQVSRLGLPLVNEVLIPLGKKDKWNASDPKDDAQFFPNILDPEPAKLIPVLYPGVTTPPGGFKADGTPKRTDIVAVLTGQAAGLSAANKLPPADLLRLNLAVPAVQGTPANRLGILNAPTSDPGGFPNGRRLTDDVVDIELRLLAGGTPLLPAYNKAPNNALTDGVDQSRVQPLNTFPYVGTPVGGYSEPESPPPAP